MSRRKKRGKHQRRYKYLSIFLRNVARINHRLVRRYGVVIHIEAKGKDEAEITHLSLTSHEAQARTALRLVSNMALRHGIALRYEGPTIMLAGSPGWLELVQALNAENGKECLQRMQVNAQRLFSETGFTRIATPETGSNLWKTVRTLRQT